MRDISGALQTRLATRNLIGRNLVWLTGTNLTTEIIESTGFWNDVGPAVVDVIDGFTGEEETRLFYGASHLIGIEDVPLTSDLTIRRLNVSLSAITAEAEAKIREYNIKGHAIQVYRLHLDPETRLPVEAALCRFAGFVDSAPLITPKEGGLSAINLTCVSHARELTRVSTATRSDESLKQRSGGVDRFYKYTAVVGSWEIFWGQKQGKVK